MLPETSKIRDEFQSTIYTDDELLGGDYMSLLVNENLLQLLVTRVPAGIIQDIKKRHGTSTLTQTALYLRVNQAYGFIASKVGTSEAHVKQAMKDARAQKTGSVTAKSTPRPGETKGPQASTIDHGDSRQGDSADAENTNEVVDNDLGQSDSVTSARSDHDEATTVSNAESEVEITAADTPIKKIKLTNKRSATKSNSPAKSNNSTKSNSPTKSSNSTKSNTPTKSNSPPIILRLFKRKRPTSEPTRDPPVKLRKLYNPQARAKTDPVVSPSIKLRLFNPKKRDASNMDNDDNESRPKLPKLKLRKRHIRSNASSQESDPTAQDNQTTTTVQAQTQEPSEAGYHTPILSSGPRASVDEQNMSPEDRENQRDAVKIGYSAGFADAGNDSPDTENSQQSVIAGASAAKELSGIPSSDGLQPEAAQKPLSEDNRGPASVENSGHASIKSSPLSSLNSSPKNSAQNHETSTIQNTSDAEHDEPCIDDVLEILNSDDGFLLELTDKYWNQNAMLSDQDALLRAAAKYTISGLVRKVNLLKPKNPINIKQISDRLWHAKAAVAGYRGVPLAQIDEEYKQAVAAQAKHNKKIKDGSKDEEGNQADIETYYSPAGRQFYRGGVKEEYK